MTAKNFAMPDERELELLRQTAPTSRDRRLRRRLAHALGRSDRLYGLLAPTSPHCACCGRRAVHRRLVVNPISLRRSYFDLCKNSRCSARLRDWEGHADARRRRAQYDWERQNPEVAPLALIGEIPPQYPSVSRATLRAFLDSGRDMATLTSGTSWTVTALNGSIKRLGFADQVFAEIRSGQAVLRRSPVRAS